MLLPITITDSNAYRSKNILKNFNRDNRLWNKKMRVCKNII